MGRHGFKPHSGSIKMKYSKILKYSVCVASFKNVYVPYHPGVNEFDVLANIERSIKEVSGKMTSNNLLLN